LVDAVRLRTLPVERPQELAYLDFASGSMRSGNFSTRSARLTHAQWEAINREQQGFSGLLAWSATRFNLATGGEARNVEGLYVSGSFFDVLRVRPAIGRFFTSAEDRPGCGTPGAVVSYAFWQREFGGDPQVLSRTVPINGMQFPVMGVAPASFFGVEVGRAFDVALPLCADATLAEDRKGRAPVRWSWWISAMGRLKPGWTVERANAQLQAVSPSIMQATLPQTYRPDEAKRYLNNKLSATSGATGVSGLRRQYETPLWLLLATTGLVLLIACANLANLLLARASVREREIAVRQAIGASRGRLVTQLLSESLLLAAAGAALGALLAQGLSQALVAFMTTSDSPLFVGLGLDWRVLGFTAALAITTCVLFGLLPAVRATSIAPSSAMRASGRGLSAGRERFTLRRVLVVTQVALSLVLLVGALLFARSLQKLLAVDPGFRPGGVVAVNVDLGRPHYSQAQYPVIHRDLLERIKTRPGIVSAAHVLFTPVSGSGWNNRVKPDGSTVESKNSLFNRVGVGYFKTMGTGLVAGRDFDDRDTGASTKVAVVNEMFVKQFFGGQNPVGRAFRVEGQAGKADPVYQIVGVVRNTKYYDVREDFLPIAFLPMAQDDEPGSSLTYVLHTNGPLGDVFSGVKSAAGEVHPEIGLEFRVITSQLKESLARDRLMATLAGGFGLLAAMLATLGLYGVIAYMVARRRNEIGIRIALGADRRSVVGLVLREASVMLAAGLVIGAGLALWAGRAAARLLFGLKAHDPVTLAGAIVLMTAVALLASYAPARRAARLDPMSALREE
jgi:predicted permease